MTPLVTCRICLSSPIWAPSARPPSSRSSCSILLHSYYVCRHGVDNILVLLICGIPIAMLASLSPRSPSVPNSLQAQGHRPPITCTARLALRKRKLIIVGVCQSALSHECHAKGYEQIRRIPSSGTRSGQSSQCRRECRSDMRITSVGAQPSCCRHNREIFARDHVEWNRAWQSFRPELIARGEDGDANHRPDCVNPSYMLTPFHQSLLLSVRARIDSSPDPLHSPAHDLTATFIAMSEVLDP